MNITSYLGQKVNVIIDRPIMTLKNGQTVTVRGTVGKQTIGVIDVNDCSVAK